MGPFACLISGKTVIVRARRDVVAVNNGLLHEENHNVSRHHEKIHSDRDFA